MKTEKQDLKNIKWLLKKEEPGARKTTKHYNSGYGDVTKLNTERTIIDHVDRKTLEALSEDIMDLLDTSIAVYEKNGDYAYGQFDSSWCQLMDSSSFKLCSTNDTKKALNCGEWLCHENCWHDSAKEAIKTGKSTDIECIGGIHLYGEPIHVGQETIGCINMGYGNPPQDNKTLLELAEKYSINKYEIIKRSKEYNPRPPFIIENAKKRLKTVAMLIGQIVENNQHKSKFQEINEKLAAQNIEYMNINDELRKTNVELNIARKNEKESKTKYKNLFNSIRDAILVADHNRKIVHSNQAFTDLFGYSKNEIKGKETSSIYKDLQEFKEVGQKLKGHMNDPGFLVTISYKKMNGEIFPGETNAFYLKDEHGEIVGFIGLIRDISARVKAENKLQETFKKLEDSESQFKALYNASFGGIYIHDKGIILECNQGLTNMTGYSREELIGMDSLLLINKSSRETVTNHILSEYEEPYEAIGLRKNSEEYPIRIEGRMIPYNDKRVRYVEFRDITEQKEYIRELELINYAAVGREERMIDLKKEVNKLNIKLGLKPSYRTDIFDDHKI